MTTLLNFKYLVDLPKWRVLTPVPLGGGFNGGQFFAYDMRNNEDRHPYIFHERSDNVLITYNVKGDQWITGFTGLVGAVQTATSGFYMSAQGPRGTITTTGNNTSFTLSTALPAAVGINQLANRGDGRGFKVRIIGNHAGGSGKTEERYIIANTSGTTPTINIDTPFSFTPATGDAYEFLSGRVYGIGNTNAAGMFKYFDVLTNSISGNLSTTNLPASMPDTIMVGLDELLVPYDRNPGEGFKGLLTATASGGTSITGQATGGDSTVAANEHRNFQIRIVQDTGTPTAVGQRRNITSHTAGPSPVYTVPAWSVTPSANAQFVIENNGDRIILWVSGNTATFTYTIAGNAWDSNTTFASAGVSQGSSAMAQQSFGIEPDIASPSNARHSFIYRFRSGSSSVLDVLDIAGASTGSWTTNVAYGNSVISIGGASSSAYDPATNQGKYMYINNGTTINFYRFDMLNRVLEPYSTLRNINPLDALALTKNMSWSVFVDGNTKLSFIFFGGTIPAGVPPTTGMFGLPITG